MNKFFSIVKNINPLKYKKGGLVASPQPPPPEVFLSFFFFPRG